MNEALDDQQDQQPRLRQINTTDQAGQIILLQKKYW